MKLALYLTGFFFAIGDSPIVANSYASELSKRFSGVSREVPSTEDRFCSIVNAREELLKPNDSEAVNSLVAKADLVEGLFVEGEKEINLVGNVEITQGEQKFSSEEVRINRQEKVATFPTPVTLSGPNMMLEGERGKASLDLEAFRLENVEFVLNEIGFRGEATQIDKENQIMSFQNVALTRCLDTDPSWVLTTKTLDIDERKSSVLARGIHLDLRGIPIFYAPYLRIPAGSKRASGWLFPDLSHGGSEGLDITLPYYLNLAPNYDATISPRLMTQRGFGGEFEFRHASSMARTVINGSLLRSDRTFRDSKRLLSRAGQSSFSNEHRWVGKIQHEGRSGPWSTLIDASAVSDMDYFLDRGALDYDGSAISHVERRAEIKYEQNGLTAWLQGQSFLDLTRQSQPYRRSPNLGISYSRPIGSAYFNVGSFWTRFNRAHRTGIGDYDRITGRRLHVEPQIQLPFIRSWGFVTAKGGVRHTEYVLENIPKTWNRKPTRTVGFASLEGSLLFERDATLFGKKMKQTLEPRVLYLRQGFENQEDIPAFDVSSLRFRFENLFGGNYFSGFDRIQDADRMSLGLTSRMLSRKNGFELARFDFGTVLHNRVPRIQHPDERRKPDLSANKNFVGQMRINWSPSLRIDGALTWDSANTRIEEVGLGVGWRSDERRVFRFSHRMVLQEQIEQTDIALKLPINSRWGLIGKWNYDWEARSDIESFVGFEYESCCVKIRTLWRQFLRVRLDNEDSKMARDQGVVLQLVFKGLAGFGNKVDKVIDRGFGSFQRTNWSANYEYF